MISTEHIFYDYDCNYKYVNIIRVFRGMKSAMNIFTAVLTLLASLSLASCTTIQTYEGHAQSTEDIAVIKSNYWDWDNLHVIVVVHEIDGYKIESPQPANVHILPGEHAVTISVTHYYTWGIYDRGSRSLKLCAEAGHTYKVHGAMKGKYTWAWIIDLNTGQLVSGSRPYWY